MSILELGCREGVPDEQQKYLSEIIYMTNLLMYGAYYSLRTYLFQSIRGITTFKTMNSSDYLFS